MTAATKGPDDLILDSPDDLAWAIDPDHDFGCEESVHDATTRTRGSARVIYAQTMETDVPLVGVWKRYARVWTRQEAWDAWGRDTFGWESAPSLNPGTSETWPKPPHRVPDDWDPGYDIERYPSWEFVPRGTAGAWPIWVCGPQVLGPPEPPVSGRGEETRP